MTGDCIGDADAADQERRQPDQRQELREALNIAFELRRGFAAAANLPAGLRKFGLRLLVERRHCAIARPGLW
jgi:hypothetical protein